ncbi:MAG: membrane associated rhomboid family serine protease [Granulosicoccus sp.]
MSAQRSKLQNKYILIPEEENNRFVKSLQLPVILILIMLVIHIVKQFTDFEFIYWGIFPRKLYGLKGILTAPLIHGSWKHLFSNAVPFLSLLGVSMYFYRIVAVRGLVMIWILTGGAVWLLGNFFDNETGNFSHIGASGVVYGLVAFVFWNGVFVKSRESIVLALAVLVLYGGMFAGILPDQPGISWESHLFGGLLGIFAAYFYKNDLLDEVERLKKLEAPQTWGEGFEVQTGTGPYFLPRDVFEKTKEERRREEMEGEDYY